MQLRYRWRVVWGIASLAIASPSFAAAQAEPSAAHGGIRVAVLRATEGDAGAIAGNVDAALLRDLAAIAGIENPTVSPIDYAEIQLTVGCSDEGRQCLSSIAELAQVDAVVVRRLAVTAEQLQLTLTYFDATASDEPTRADQSFTGTDAGERAVAAVPVLVRKLFGVPEPVVAASAEPVATATAPRATLEPAPARVREEQHPARIGALTWITLAGGAAVLAGGIVLGASAQSSFDNFKSFQLKATADVAPANGKLDVAKSKALAADVMMPVGGAILALGGVLLALDLMHEDKPSKVAVIPVRGGAVLSLSTATEGF